MKLAYGYERAESDLVALGVDPDKVFIDVRRDRPLRDDLLKAAREGDEVLVLYLRDLGGSPVADRIWRERIEAKGATVVEVRPEARPRKMGRPRKWEPEDSDQERAVAAAWLGGGSELTRLRRASEAAGQTLGKGLLHGRYGSPDNPKFALGGDS